MKIFTFRNHRGLIFTESFPAELVWCLVPASTDRGTESNYIQVRSFALKVPSSRSQPLRSFAMVFISRVLSGHQLSAMTATTKSYLHIIFRQGMFHPNSEALFSMFCLATYSHAIARSQFRTKLRIR
jgi:hypothetical protein